MPPALSALTRLAAPSLAVFAISLLAPACPGSSNCPLRTDGGGARVVQVKGRVVDFETCLTMAGCRGMPGVTVGLLYNNGVYSAPTTDSGAFALTSVPDGAVHYLLVTDTNSGGEVLPTLQADPIRTSGGDLVSVELYGLKRTGGLYSGVSSEAGVDVQSHALYLGQVLSVDGGKMKAIPDVQISVVPAADIRYVNCIPSFSQCAGQTTLFASRSTTGVFGEFVVISKSGAKDHVIWGASNQYSFSPLMVPLSPGYVTVGLHRSVGAAPPSADAGLQPDYN